MKKEKLERMLYDLCRAYVLVTDQLSQYLADDVRMKFLHQKRETEEQLKRFSEAVIASNN